MSRNHRKEIQLSAYRNAYVTVIIMYGITVILNDMFFGIKNIDYKYISSITLVLMVLVYNITYYYLKKKTKKNK